MDISTIEEMLEVMESYPKITEYYNLTTLVIEALPIDKIEEIDETRLPRNLLKDLLEFCEAIQIASDIGDDEEAVLAYLQLGCEISNFQEAFCGEYDSEVEYATELVNDCYDIKQQMGSLSYYFNYKAFARDLFTSDYDYVNGYVFRSNV